MKKHFILGLLIAALAIGFTGCKQASDPGTAPTITKFFITNHNATVDATTLNSLTRLTNVSVYPTGTTSEHAPDKYKEVLAFSDPDKDVVKAEFSFNNFSTIIPANITQTYANQISTWNDEFYTGLSGTVTYSIRLIDSKGNVSNTVSFQLTTTAATPN